MNAHSVTTQPTSDAPKSKVPHKVCSSGVVNTLRVQFTLVIFMLAFLPNLILAITMQPGLPTRATVLWMLVVAAMCGVIGYMLSGALLRPLSRLQKEITLSDFSEPHDDDPLEIRQVRKAFTGLIDRLGTEQARRNAFMATLVHDLKTPLIATGHLTKTLTTLPLPDAERREVGEHIQHETERLLGLVQQMADAHRFERDDVNLNTSKVQLRDVLQSVARRITPQAEAKGLTLTVTGEAEAEIDVHVFERAVMNLAENALRYGADHVGLGINEHGVTITDDGPGLSTTLDQLAQPFNGQAATIAGKEYMSGTAGLGLFIARRIAEAHGGSLQYARVSSESDFSLSAETQLEDQAEGGSQSTPSLTQFTLQLPEVQP